jgi:hypothetical protein
VTVPADEARLLAPCEPQVLVGIAHNKTNDDHPLPIRAWHKSTRTVVGPGDARWIETELDDPENLATTVTINGAPSRRHRFPH